MRKSLLLAAAITVVLMSLTACKSHSGSREYAPGKGWQQN
jgi:hypothetical protein